MGDSKEHITDIIKYIENNQEVWFYSTDNQNAINRYKYYMLTLQGNFAKLEEIDNAMQKIQGFKTIPEDINENTLEYIKFLAVKEYAEKQNKKTKKR